LLAECEKHHCRQVFPVIAALSLGGKSIAGVAPYRHQSVSYGNAKAQISAMRAYIELSPTPTVTLWDRKTGQLPCFESVFSYDA